MRQGRLFRQNQETVSIVYLNARYTPYKDESDPAYQPKYLDVASDVECVFHPNTAVGGNISALAFEDSVPISEAEWIVLLAVPNDAIKDTHIIRRANGDEHEIIGMQTFAGVQHLLAKGQGVQ